MCDCVDRVNEKLRDYNTILVFNMLCESDVFVATNKIVQRKRGKAKLMLATYCPFCGEKKDPDRARIA